MDKPKMYRHGDVFVQYVNTIPSDARRVEPGPRGYVIAEGEATGHAHTLEATPDVEMYEKDGTLYCRVLAPVPFLHEEHNLTKGTQQVPTLAPGIYTFPGQRTWDSGSIRKVVD